MRTQEKYVSIILGVICIILCASFLLYFINSDTTPPIISFEGETPIYVSEDDNILLSNVIARDNKDGDITNKVIIDKIQFVEDNTKAKITYIVSDSSGNTANATQLLSCKEEQQESVAEEPVEEEPIEEEPIEEPVDIDPEAPVLTLNTQEATIGINDDFRYNDYIESIVDDVDSTSTLWRRIHLDGDYSTKAPGTYQVTFFVIDTQGKQSIPQVLALTRQ